MTESYLYVVFSSTPYRMGAFIRRFTGYAFNHVSVCLHDRLEPLYSFARHYYHAPFYGGFVKESLLRYHANGRTAHIRVFRIPVSPEQHAKLRLGIEDMLLQQEQYLYNHLSALTVPFRKTVKAADAYTCIEYCVQLLHSIGLNITPGVFYSLKDLEQLLLPYEYYTGPAPQSDTYDASFYAPKPLPHPIRTSLSAFFALFKRLNAQ